MAVILGLDLGSHSVKGLWLESNMRASQVRAFKEVPLPPVSAELADLPSRTKVALQQLFASQPMNADQVVIALPGPAIATHSITLPFVDAKKVEATIPFEVESLLPFDLSEAVYDYQLASVHDQKSDLLVGLVRQGELSTLLSWLEELKIDPRIVTHPGINLWNLVTPPNAKTDTVSSSSAIAIVDIGHERTNLCIGRMGTGVEFARTLSSGGKDITKALAGQFQVSLEEAEQWKESNGAVGSAAGFDADSQKAAATCAKGLQTIVRELRTTLKAFEARTRTQVESLVLCGGTARLKGIDDWLSKELGVPVTCLTMQGAWVASLAEAQKPLAGAAMALAIRGQASGPKAQRFNFRRGQFAFKGDLDYVKEKIPQLVAFAAILLVLFVGSGMVRNHLLEARVKELDTKFCDIAKGLLGSCDRNRDKVLQMLNGQSSPAASVPKGSAVNYLAELIERVPSNVPLKVDQVVVELDRISLRCETDSSKNVDAITAALKGNKCFQELQAGKLEKSSDGKKVTFRLDIRVECPNDELPQG